MKWPQLQQHTDECYEDSGNACICGADAANAMWKRCYAAYDEEPKLPESVKSLLVFIASMFLGVPVLLGFFKWFIICCKFFNL